MKHRFLLKHEKVILIYDVMQNIILDREVRREVGESNVRGTTRHAVSSIFIYYRT